MIKKLRLRFIISALLSILFVLSATIVAINVSNYIKTENESIRILNMIAENEQKDVTDPGGSSGGTWGGYGGNRPPRENDTRNQEHYFIVMFSTEGDIIYSNYSHIFTIEDEAAQNLAIQVYQGKKTQGKHGKLRYKKENATYSTSGPISYQYNYVFVTFVDISDRTNSFDEFLKNSIIISSVSYAVIAALIIMSSHFVFKTSEESYKKQKAFITNASHELKTPLTIINTDVEILKMDNGDNEWIDSINDQVRRLTTMTNQLVTLSKLDENSINNYPLTSIPISEIAKEGVNAFALTFKKNGFNFSSDIEDGLFIKGNRNLINELLYILMDNALKYAKVKGDINLTLKKNKNKVEMNFSNDIEDDEIDVNLLFERFYRSPQVSKKEGSGIGLSIAKEIADLHKAKINASVKESRIWFNIVF